MSLVSMVAQCNAIVVNKVSGKEVAINFELRSPTVWSRLGYRRYTGDVGKCCIQAREGSFVTDTLLPRARCRRDWTGENPMPFGFDVSPGYNLLERKVIYVTVDVLHAIRNPCGTTGCWTLLSDATCSEIFSIERLHSRAEPIMGSMENRCHVTVPHRYDVKEIRHR